MVGRILSEYARIPNHRGRSLPLEPSGISRLSSSVTMLVAVDNRIAQTSGVLVPAAACVPRQRVDGIRSDVVARDRLCIRVAIQPEFQYGSARSNSPALDEPAL
jgi:hypothetical protein